MPHENYPDNLLLGATDVGPASSQFVQWAKAAGVPATAIALFRRAWVREAPAMLGTLVMMDEPTILESAAEEPCWLAAGFLLIGACGNGDMVALDCTGGAVCYLSHEALWGDESAAPRQFSVRVAENLADLAARAWDDDFPIDFDDARERAD